MADNKTKWDEVDKTLSETLIEQAQALEKWDEVKTFATEMENLVSEYSELIDSVSTVFTVVGFVWNIYSNIEKAKEDAAQREDMVKKITQAVDGMITRAKTEIEHHADVREVEDAVTDAQSVLDGFRLDVIPYAKTYPLTGFDSVALELLIRDARKAISKLHGLIRARAEVGDGSAILTLYRNLHAVVQCKLTLDRWRHGLTQAVVTAAESDMGDLIEAWVPVCEGLFLMSDKSFSPGIVKFQVGGHGRPGFTQYSVYYKGKALPGSSSNMAKVSQDFIAVRRAARSVVIPEELVQWNNHTWDIVRHLQELKGKVPA